MEDREKSTTVAALSTPFGRGGVAVIRVSGSDAFAVAEKVFAPAGGRRFSSLRPRCAVYGDVLYDGQPIDDGLLLLFPAPHSYTGEDCAEISCHGGMLLSSKVLEAVLLAGARPAEAGEFTRRAFMNGKISLSRAEAVMDLINAESEDQLRLAGANARGRLSEAVDAIYERLSFLLAQTYVLIDYPDEDLSDLSDKEFTASLRAVRDDLSRLADGYKAGRAVMEGIPTVIAGRPNTGKSSLLNALLGKDRAIVSPYSGTTRDTVEEDLHLGRVLLRLCDTAGLRTAADPVEILGVRRSYEKLDAAELVFAVFDASEPAAPEDLAFIEYLRPQSGRVIALLNKCDLPERFDASLLDGFFLLRVSARSGVLPPALTARVESLFETERLDIPGAVLLTGARQAAAVREAVDALDRALCLLAAGESRDMAAFDAEDALRALGRLDGKVAEESIVNAIFSRFCVGK